MRRVILLALLALTLPTAASASSTPFDFFVCNRPANFCPEGFVIGAIKGSFTTTITGTLTGFRIGVSPAQLITIRFTTGTLIPSKCGTPGSTCFAWTSDGSVTVLQKGSVLFKDSLNQQSGEVILTPQWFIGMSGLLTPSVKPPTTINGRADFIAPFTGFPALITVGLASVSGTITVSEPSAIEGLLLGIGVLGLPGLARRKLNLGM